VSRIGKQPIPVPSGVDVTIDGSTVSVRGPKGTLTQTFDPAIEIALEEGVVYVRRPNDERRERSLHGLTRTLVANMITGVSEGFVKNLEIVGVGYRAQVQGGVLTLTVGYSNPVNYPIPKGIEVEASGKGQVSIKGIDKRLVGTVASEVRAVRPPEPYKGKGIKYTDERIRRKVGKTGA